MAVLRSVKGGAPDRVDGFELAYVTRDGAQARVALANAGSLPLERAVPVRRFASYKGQRHLPGRWREAACQPLAACVSMMQRCGKSSGLSNGFKPVRVRVQKARNCTSGPVSR
jgi:hypothetical protein